MSAELKYKIQVHAYCSIHKALLYTKWIFVSSFTFNSLVEPDLQEKKCPKCMKL